MICYFDNGCEIGKLSEMNRQDGIYFLSYNYDRDRDEYGVCGRNMYASEIQQVVMEDIPFEVELHIYKHATPTILTNVICLEKHCDCWELDLTMAVPPYSSPMRSHISMDKLNVEIVAIREQKKERNR